MEYLGHWGADFRPHAEGFPIRSAATEPATLSGWPSPEQVRATFSEARCTMGWPKMKITQLADQVRNIPLREVLERYGFQAKPEGTTLRAKS